MKQLRPHQVEAVEAVKQAFREGYRKICLQAPTGMGKTVIATHIIHSAIAKGKKVLFMVHLKELIDQTAIALTEAGLSYGYISAEYPFTRNKNLYLASTQTLVKRFDRLDFKPDLIIYDEFHHACAKTSLKILDFYKSVALVGLTATPERLDGKGLNIVADKLIQTTSTKWLIDNQYLSEFEYYAPPSGIDFSKVHMVAGDYNAHELDEEIEKTTIFGKVVEHYKQYVYGKPALVFALKITHSIKMLNEFKAAGIPAAHIDSNTPKGERNRIVNQFRNGTIWVLLNVALVTEGFDVPACQAVFITRPTKSTALFLQMVGRGLRKSGDDVCYIFDHVENYLEHGLPDEERTWSLEGREIAEKKKKEQKKHKTCLNCSFTYKITIKECPKCKFKEPELKPVEHKEGSLQKITAASTVIKKNQFTKEQIKQMKRECKTLEDYSALARKLNYKPGWARMQMELKNQWKAKYSKR